MDRHHSEGGICMKRLKRLLGPLSLFCFLFITWILLSGRLEIPALITGTVVSLLIIRLTWGVFFVGTLGPKEGQAPPIHLRIGLIIAYIPYFFWNLFISTFEVAVIALSRNIRIRPGIVGVDLKIRNKTAIVLLANQVTLTPGTLSVDVDMANHRLFIHSLNLKKGKGKQMIARFEEMEAQMRRMLG